MLGNKRVAVNPVRGVLAEELASSLRMLGKYRQASHALPKGALVEKKIRGRVFCYAAYRDGKRIKFDYKGKLSPKEKAKYWEAMRLRAKYRCLISDLNKQISFLERVLHERKRRSKPNAIKARR